MTLSVENDQKSLHTFFWVIIDQQFFINYFHEKQLMLNFFRQVFPWEIIEGQLFWWLVPWKIIEGQLFWQLLGGTPIIDLLMYAIRLSAYVKSLIWKNGFLQA